MQVEFLPEAEAELLESIGYYNAQQPGLGDRFNREFWETVARIEGFPEAAPLIAEGIRRKRLTRFPYGIVYVVREVILVVAVMHLHRRPDYWEPRLR